MRQPGVVLSECNHENADGQPIPIPDAGSKFTRSVLEEPAQVLHLPLVGPPAPPPTNLIRDRRGAPEMSTHGRCSRPGQAAYQQRLDLTDCPRARGGSRHYLAEPT